MATTYFGALAQLSARINHTPMPPLQKNMEDALAPIRQQLGRHFPAAWDSDQTVALEEVLALAIDPWGG